MAEVTLLRDAVAELVQDGDRAALEDFTHPIPTAGAYEIIRGARILTTLLYEMRRRPDARYGLATMCIGLE